MIAVPTAPWAHLLGDLCAWATAALTAWWQHRHWPAATQTLARQTAPGYFLALGLGALAGAWLIGSANTLRQGLVPSHSVAGALAGGIVAVELWKWRHGVRQSTGGSFVLPLCAGIAVGRLGCFFSGLADQTYGTPTALPWAVDLGDHIGRHPVQFYESLTIALFGLACWRARRAGQGWARDHAFHALILVYAVQRFGWEFLKPYPPVVGRFNVFHLLMGALIVYGIIWWRTGRTADNGDSPG